MPINIQEILYPNDSDSIKWEKVNYNFDQIIATGGKEGPKGDKGSVGPTGTVGAKGEQGAQGALGEKGEPGTSVNYWDQFTSTTQNITSYVIKPKNGTGDDQAAVIIGDPTYDESNTNGTLDPSAQLTVYTDAYYYTQKWGPSSGSDFLTFRGESSTVNGTTGTKWIVQPEGQGTNTEILLDSQKITINSSNDVVITPGGDVSIANGGDFNVTSTGDFVVDVDAMSITSSGAVGLSGATIDLVSGATGVIEIKPSTISGTKVAIKLDNTSSGSEIIQARGKFAWATSSYQSTDSDAPVMFNGTSLSSYVLKVINNSSNQSKMLKLQGQGNYVDLWTNKITIVSSSTEKVKIANDLVTYNVPVTYGVQTYNWNPVVGLTWSPPTTLTVSHYQVFVGMDYLPSSPSAASYNNYLDIPDGTYIGQRLFVRVTVLPAGFSLSGQSYTSIGNIIIRAKQYSTIANGSVDTASSTNTTGEEIMVDMIWVENDHDSYNVNTLYQSKGQWRVLSKTTHTL